jgi:hypothetical protein
MAAISAIATLQLSAALADAPTDRIALSNAAEYLTKHWRLRSNHFRHHQSLDKSGATVSYCEPVHNNSAEMK